MKKNLTEIITLIDNDLIFDIDGKVLINSCNSFLNRFSGIDKEINITFLKYSDSVEALAMNKPVAKFSVKKLTPKKNGASAMIDSTAETIIKTGERYAAQPCEEHPENVVFILFAAGADNASKHYTYQELNDMISHQTDIYNWNFYLLTTNYSIAKNIAIDDDNTISFDLEEPEALEKASDKLADLIISLIEK